MPNSTHYYEGMPAVRDKTDLLEDSLIQRMEEKKEAPSVIDTIYYQPDESIPAYLNKRNGKDAGYDLYSTETKWFWPFQTRTIKANIHVLIPDGKLGWVASRGGHAGRGWLTHTGIIDTGYTGQIGVMQTNLSIFPRRVKKGERLAQLIFVPFSAVFGWKKCKELNEFDREVLELTGSNRGTQAYNSSGLY